MSRRRNLSEVELKKNFSCNKLKTRSSVEQKRSLGPKIVKDSPYSNMPNITKTRSISSIKTKSPNKSRGNSPKQPKKNLSTNNSMNNISSIEPAVSSQRTMCESYRQAHKDVQPKIGHKYINSLVSIVPDTLEIESRLKDLSKKPITNSIGEYYKLFDEIIEKDQVYGKLLRKIKSAIEIWDKTQKKILEHAEKAEKSLLENAKKLQVMIEDRKVLDRRMQQITQENLDLVRSLEESEVHYSDLESRLFKITNFSLNNIDKTESTWKALVIENKSYAEMCKRMKSELKIYKSKEIKLLKLVLAMKNRGYPIEEVFNTDVCGVVGDTEGSESERLLTGSGPKIEKPPQVPSLDIDKIEPEIFSNSSIASSPNLIENNFLHILYIFL